jgi:ABC-2 type transport system permease protein
MKLLYIEWLKYKPNRALWVLLGMFVIMQTLVIYGMDSFKLNLTGNENGQQVNFGMLGVLTLPKVWVYLSYIAGFFKIILAVAVIMLICNEFEYRTFRQHLIDGLSRSQLVFSKFLTVASFTLLSGILLTLLVVLFAETSESEIGLFENSEFVLAYMLQNLGYLSFAFLGALLLRKTSLTIIMLLLYSFIIEPMINYKFPEIGAFLPLETFANLIRSPFTSIMGTDLQSSIDMKQVVQCLIYVSLFWIASLSIVKQRDY